MAKMTSLEDPKFKRLAIARDTLVGCVPGPLPVAEYKQNLRQHGIPEPCRRTVYLDLADAREAMKAMPEVSEVKSWLSHLMMHLTSKSYQKGKFQSAIGGGKLLAELTGALAPPQEVDRSVEIARYLQDQQFTRRGEHGESAEDDDGGQAGADRRVGAIPGEGAAGEEVSAD